MSTQETLLKQFDGAFNLTPQQVEKVITGLNGECDTGLRTSSEAISTMIPSFVTALPTGQEQGTYLAMDLGGTNLRITAVQLLGDGKIELIEEKRKVTKELQTGKADAFFDWIADATRVLITEKAAHLFSEAQVRHEEPLSMGVTWSFPINLTAIDKGNCLRMGKGFVIEGVEGNDLVEMMDAAFRRQKMNVHVNAVLNDTVGTLIAAAYLKNPHVRISVIAGTGSNAANCEKVKDIIKLPADIVAQHDPEDLMIMNTEWDIMGSDTELPRTKYDDIVDSETAHPGFQPFETMISGLWIGELVRLVIHDFVKQGALFGGVLPRGMEAPLSFETARMSEIERAKDLNDIADILRKHYTIDTQPTDQDLSAIQHIVQTIGNRTAVLTAAAVAALIRRDMRHFAKEDEDIVVAFTGSVYEHYPNMEQKLRHALADIFGASFGDRLKLVHAPDGSAIGAAICAMVVDQKQEK
ncbi:hypothetical protein BZG36_01136 [Bifiguratus adelaidae]|uniref:Phosphotransferase n=1 Tax=Bifiguratus adelaidae TaxID=1938954 RepID=A0A261Y682_9FUNG|nr:hypothetical protein BZG36_01136 [Bifiguratus adelaidae]